MSLQDLEIEVEIIEDPDSEACILEIYKILFTNENLYEEPTYEEPTKEAI